MLKSIERDLGLDFNIACCLEGFVLELQKELSHSRTIRVARFTREIGLKINKLSDSVPDVRRFQIRFLLFKEYLFLGAVYFLARIEARFFLRGPIFKIFPSFLACSLLSTNFSSALSLELCTPLTIESTIYNTLTLDETFFTYKLRQSILRLRFRHQGLRLNNLLLLLSIRQIKNIRHLTQHP